MSTFICDLAVVYDIEESIKDMEEFADYAQDGDKWGKTVTITDSHRMKILYFKKASQGE